MAAATLTFPSQTLLKNVVDPVDGTDAATKEYVDGRTGAGTVAAAGSNTQIQFNSASTIGASSALTFDYSSNILTITGNVNTDNLKINSLGNQQIAISLNGNIVGGPDLLWEFDNAALFTTGLKSNGEIITTGNIISANANLGNTAHANYFTGDGGLLSNIIAAGGASETVSSSSQPNITSIGNLVNLQIGNLTSGPGGANGIVYFDGNGDANLSGNIIAAGNISVGTGTGGSIIGANSVTANYFIGDGSLLTNLPGQNISAVPVSNYANYAGNVVNSNQPNITTVGELTTLVVSGDANVQGNLTVGGTLTYIDSTKVSIVDPILDLGGGVDGATLTSQSTTDRGVLLHNYTTEAVDAYMGWQTSTGNFIFGSNVTETLGVITVNQYANIVALNFSGNVISSNANIGNLIAGNANFSQPVILTSPADSTNDSTGALILTQGGLGVYGNINSGMDISGSTLTGNITTSDQSNITKVGTLGNLSVSGNISTGNISTGNLTVTKVSDLGVVGNVKITGGSSGQYLQTDGTGNLIWQDAASTNEILSGTSNVKVVDNKVLISSNGNSNVIVVNGNSVSVNGTLSISNLTTANTLNVSSTTDSTLYNNGALVVQGGVGVAGNVNFNKNLTVTDDIFANNITVHNSATFQGLSEFQSIVTLTGVTDSINSSTGVLILATGGLGVAGNINSAQDVSGSTLTGTLTTHAQPNITSVGTLTSLNVSGNITSGNVDGGNLVKGTYLQGTLTTATQPNITTVGTLLDLDVTGNTNTGNLQVTGNSNLGSVSNLTITGGTSGQYLQTDGAGNVVWSTVSTSSLINGTSNIVINNSSNVNISANSQANVLQVSGTQVVIGPTTESTSYTTGSLLVNGGLGVAGNVFINGLLNISGDFQVGNLNTTGPVEHTGEVSFTQLSFFTNAAVSTSTTSGAVQITGGLGVQGNIYGGNIISAANTILRNGRNVPTFTSSGTMPTSPLLGDEWYDQQNDRIYQYIFDGASYNWIDVSGGYISANVQAQPGTLVVRDNNGDIFANVMHVNNLAVSGTVSAGSGVPVSNTNDTIIDTFTKTLYRSAKYIISARNDDGYEVMEVLLIHDDSISFIQTYGDVSTGSIADIVTLSSSIVNGNVCLYAIGSNSNTFVNLVSTYVTD